MPAPVGSGPRATGRGLRRCLVVLVCLLGAIAACSDDDAPPDVPDRAGRPIDGGTLRVGLVGPITVDPARASPAAPGDQLVADLLHRGLTDLDDQGRAGPAVAVAWSADPEQRTWRFTLDPGARFASGRAVTATDVVTSLQRVIAGGDASLAALRLEDVEGFRAYLDGTAPTVSGLRALDATTIEIALGAPLAVLPELLAAPAYGVVDVATLTGPPGRTPLDLSGGWAAGEADEGRLLLQRREGTPGHLDAVELRSYPDAAAAFDAFEAGDLDWAPVPADRVGDAASTYGRDHFTPFQAELLLGLRTTVPTLSSTALRQAVAASIDVVGIVRAVYPDLADPLLSLVPAGLPGRPVADAAPCSACGYDPDRARALVAEAFPAGDVPPVGIDVEASPAQEALARIVAEGLEAVGIPAAVRARPLEEHQRLLVAGGGEVFTFGWVGGAASPDAYLTPLLRSTSVDNLVGLASPDVDALLAEARASGDPAVRAARWADVERQVLDAALVVPIAQFRTQAVVAAPVQDLRTAVDGTIDWSRVWLADGG